MTSRLVRGTAALALAVPLTVAAVTAPAAAAGPHLVDRWGPGPQWSSMPTQTSLDVSVATDTEATGLVTVSSSVTGGAAPGQVTDLHHPIAVTDETTGERTPLRNLVEVSSDIISGDSGGALLDAEGDVVGMNVAASSGAADVTGYVIPIGRVLRIVDAVLAGADTATVAVGDSVHTGAYLGVGLADTTVA